jgi:hypothetical protein
MSARINRAFLLNQKSSWDLWWQLRESVSRGGKLEILQATHFTNSVDTEGVAAPAATRSSKRYDWRVAAEVVTYGRFE